MNYLEEFLLKRNANVSNVFIFETQDPKRISQFISSMKNNLIKADKYIFDIQTQELFDIITNSPVQLDPMMSVTQQLLTLLRNKPSIVIIKYVYEQRHAQFLSDFLIAASHDDKLYSHKSTVIVFTSDSSLFSTSLLRLVYSISIPPSTATEREELLKKLASDISDVLKRSHNVDLKLDVNADLISASSGLTLHDVETAALESFYLTRKFTVEKFTEYKVKILREVGLQYIQPARGFESVGGYDYLKQYIKSRVIKPLRTPELASRYGLGVPKGILLYGPPGTGKSWFAKALAKEVGLPMVSLNPADFLRGIVGETEARVRQITTIIESLSPVVVFIDEFDQLTMSRESVMSTDSGVTRRMTNMLLEWLGREDRKAFVIGATNFVEHIDSAFLRPGRLDEVIPVLPPDTIARQEILKVHTNVVRKVPVSNADFKEIAERTYAWTGAELEKLVLEAAHLAMEEEAPVVEQRHFDEALKAIDVNVQEREQRLKLMIQKLKKLENVNQHFLKQALNFYSQSEGGRVKGVLEVIK